eukprot:CCRYP_019128-RG/>CCRYP_019128-RG protein AED:0.47 eAED:0.47 QI:0/-1/0/1/-1/0/1/0/59
MRTTSPSMGEPLKWQVFSTGCVQRVPASGTSLHQPNLGPSVPSAWKAMPKPSWTRLDCR